MSSGASRNAKASKTTTATKRDEVARKPSVRLPKVIAKPKVLKDLDYQKLAWRKKPWARSTNERVARYLQQLDVGGREWAHTMYQLMNGIKPVMMEPIVALYQELGGEEVRRVRGRMAELRKKGPRDNPVVIAVDESGRVRA